MNDKYMIFIFAFFSGAFLMGFAALLFRCLYTGSVLSLLLSFICSSCGLVFLSNKRV